jgi:hypothetical protein
MNAIYDSELYHFGVKGMKWGIRNERARIGKGRRSSGSKSSTHSKKREVSEADRQRRKETAIKVGKVAAVAAIAAVGTYAITSRKTNQYKSMAKRAVQIADDRNSMAKRAVQIADDRNKLAKRAVSLADRERKSHLSDIKDSYNIIKNKSRGGRRGRQKRADTYLKYLNKKGSL